MFGCSFEQEYKIHVTVSMKINSFLLLVSMLIMIIPTFILLTGEIIVFLNGNLVQRKDKLLQVEME
jgi:hypothetical protein